MAKARICVDLSTFVSTSRHRGFGSYALELARALGRVAPRFGELELQLLIGPGARLRVLPLEQGLARLPAALAHPLVLPDGAFYALRNSVGRAALLRARPRLYHSLEPKGTPWFAAPKTVVTCHDLVPVVMGYPFAPKVLPAGSRALVEWLRYRAADHVLAISRTTRQDLLAVSGLPESRVTVVHHGVNRAQFRPEPEPGEPERVAEFLGSTQPYFFYVGGYDPRRQVPLLVRAFARHAAHKGCALALCGHVEPALAEALRNEARRHNAEGQLLLPGFVPPELLAPLYRQATAHTLLSRYEGFGMTVLEAFACGCPVIACRASCLPEVAGEAALLVDPEGEAEAGRAMARLADDDAERARLRELGLARAARFTWDRCAERTLELYQRVLG